MKKFGLVMNLGLSGSSMRECRPETRRAHGCILGLTTNLYTASSTRSKKLPLSLLLRSNDLEVRARFLARNIGRSFLCDLTPATTACLVVVVILREASGGRRVQFTPIGQFSATNELLGKSVTVKRRRICVNLGRS